MDELRVSCHMLPILVHECHESMLLQDWVSSWVMSFHGILALLLSVMNRTS